MWRVVLEELCISVEKKCPLLLEHPASYLIFVTLLHTIQEKRAIAPYYIQPFQEKAIIAGFPSCEALKDWIWWNDLIVKWEKKEAGVVSTLSMLVGSSEPPERLNLTLRANV